MRRDSEEGEEGEVGTPAVKPSTSLQSKEDSLAQAFRCRRNLILVLLVGQITLSALLMRYSRTRQAAHEPKYHATAAVLMTEALKLPICLVLTVHAVGGVHNVVRLMRSELPTVSTLKCAVPACAYTLQGNLLFFATANLETPTFQVTYQTKTLFTALFSVVILGRQLVRSQWLALLLLFFGTVLASDLGTDSKRAAPTSKSGSQHESPLLGLVAVFAAAMCARHRCCASCMPCCCMWRACHLMLTTSQPHRPTLPRLQRRRVA